MAAELEARIGGTFDEVAVREPTRLLLRDLANAINEIEEAGRKLDPAAATWDQSLITWAMVREMLANGPVLEKVPHPDSAKSKDIGTQPPP